MSSTICPIVFAPKTRLAAELIRLLQQFDRMWDKPLLVARSLDEQTELLAKYPDAQVRLLDQLHATADAKETQSTVIFCCALGPLHPRQPREPSVDFSSVPRDLESLLTLVNTLRGQPIEIVYVSSVLAISSGTDRFYYSGWKRVIESAIRLGLDPNPHAHWTAIYSGRLVTEKSVRNPSSLLATSYAQLAQRMLRRSSSSVVRSIVGCDARLLLMQRALATAWSAISGRVV